MKNIDVPFLGEGITSVILSCWYLKKGDDVCLGQDVAEVAADKAIFNIESEHKGRLAEIFFKEGQSAKVGETIAIVE